MNNSTISSYSVCAEVCVIRQKCYLKMENSNIMFVTAIFVPCNPYGRQTLKENVSYGTRYMLGELLCFAQSSYTFSISTQCPISSKPIWAKRFVGLARVSKHTISFKLSVFIELKWVIHIWVVHRTYMWFKKLLKIMRIWRAIY